MWAYIRVFGTIGVVLLILLSFVIWFTLRWRKKPKIWIPSAVFLVLVLAVNIMFGLFVEFTRPRISKAEALKVAFKTGLAESFVKKYPDVGVSASGFCKWLGPDTLVYFHARRPVEGRSDLSMDVLLIVPVRNAERRAMLDKQQLRVQIFNCNQLFVDVSVKNAAAFLRNGPDQSVIEGAVVELESPVQKHKSGRILVEQPAGNIHSASPYSKDEVRQVLGTVLKGEGQTQSKALN